MATMYKAKIVKLDSINKYTILVYEKLIKRWISCGTVDSNGNELINVFDDEDEAEIFAECHDLILE
jgi:hypothetical protein